MNLARWIRSLFAHRSAARKAPLRGFRPQVEGLTERIMPAVTANVVAGVLTVNAVGAAADDSLLIAPVSGFAGRFSVTGSNGTVVNTYGANGVFDAIGVTSMKFDLGEGDDTVDGDNLIVAGGITVLGGNGNNRFILDHSTIGGSVSVTNLTNTGGIDMTLIRNSTINGSVTVNNGLGSTGGYFYKLNILGSLQYTTTSSVLIPGNDTVSTYGLNVGGNIAVNLANGSNGFEAGILGSEPIEAGGSFTYTGGSGIDTLDVRFGATFGTSATISLGENNNDLQVTGPTGLFVGTTLTVTAGAGTDTINLSSTALSRVGGAAVFNLGNGTNTFTTTGLRAGSLSLSNGAGDDTATIDNLNVAAGLSFLGGDGVNTLTLSNSLIGGSVSVTNLTNSLGNDVTKISSSTINGNVIVNNGLGSAEGTFTEVTVMGGFQYTTPSSAVIPGADNLFVKGLKVGGSITLALGDGGNSTYGTVAPIEAGGSFTYTGGNSFDLVQFFRDTTFGASATFNMGGGSNQLDVTSSNGGLFVGTTLTVNGGAGIDVINLTSDALSRVYGAASFNLGSGTNTFTTTGLRVGSLNLTNGAGDDTATIDNLTVAGGFTFLGGDGVNTLTVDNSNVGGSLSVTNLTNTTGSDNTTIHQSTVNGNVSVNNGLGATIGSFYKVNILGSLTYTTASSALIPGDDSVEVGLLNVGGNITVTLANGNNTLFGLVSSLAPFQAGGNFTYTGGAGTDTVDLRAGAIVGASATITLGENENSVLVNWYFGLFVGAKLTVTAGAGNDSINLSSTSEISRVSGAASFNLGDGTNTFTTSSLRVGSLGLTTGSGNDTGTFDNLTVVGAANLNFGAGTNTVNLASSQASSSPTTIGGALTLTTGAGADTVQVGANNAVRVGGAAMFTHGTSAVGNGNDSLQINNALFASSLGIFGGSGVDTVLLANLASVSIAGRLTVSTNAGDDRLDLGVPADSNKVVRLLVVPSLNGGAGSVDVLRMFVLGNVQGPPGIVVFPANFVGAGWEGIG